MRTTLSTSNTILNRYQSHPQPDNSTAFKPSVKYVKFGPSYENLPEKIREMEDEGIYEILDKDKATEGVASSEDLYDKLYFNYWFDKLISYAAIHSHTPIIVLMNQYAWQILSRSWVAASLWATVLYLAATEYFTSLFWTF